jgi:hypothetical protein
VASAVGANSASASRIASASTREGNASENKASRL